MFRTPFTDRRTLLTAGAALAATASCARPAEPRATDWAALGEDVKAEMAWAWRNYADRCLGQDQIKPVSGGVEPFFFPDRPMGLSIVEAFGTLWLMGLESEFEQGLGWVHNNLSFDIDGEVRLFETSIRLMGGLLSGHIASGDPRLLELAHDLGRRLMPAFTKSPTGMPYRFVNLRTAAVRDPHTNPAEVGTYMPEWGTLAKLTGDRRFYDVPKRAVQAMFDRRSKLDLLADAIDCETGKWESRKATIGPPSDSYYEYLWDAWQLFGDADFKRMYDVCTNATLKWQSDVYQGRLWFAHVDFETGKKLDTRQTELDAFYGGLLGQGGHMGAGRAYTLSWSAVQDKYGVIPEGFDYASFSATVPSNALRPELADSCINLWLLDRDELWRQIGRTHFENMRRWNKARYGYTGLKNVTTTPKIQADLCPGYWWSEQMKYYWLLFSDTPRFDYKTNYLSTEGDVLLGFRKT